MARQLSILRPMKTTSKYFDKIRVSTAREAAAAERAAKDRQPPCQWKGCDKPGPHRAPMGRGRDGQYYFFCVDHVRQYNQSYNYFDGMNDSEVADFQKDAMTGHRPTWKMGAGIAGGIRAKVLALRPTKAGAARARRTRMSFSHGARKRHVHKRPKGAAPCARLRKSRSIPWGFTKRPQKLKLRHDSKTW